MVHCVPSTNTRGIQKLSSYRDDSTLDLYGGGSWGSVTRGPSHTQRRIAEGEKAFGGVTMDRRSTRLFVFLHSLQVFVCGFTRQRSKKVDVVSFIGPS